MCITIRRGNKFHNFCIINQSKKPKNCDISREPFKISLQNKKYSLLFSKLFYIISNQPVVSLWVPFKTSLLWFYNSFLLHFNKIFMKKKQEKSLILRCWLCVTCAFAKWNLYVFWEDIVYKMMCDKNFFHTI
jgi:hypothetical protein